MLLFLILLALLEHPSWRVRECATRGLARLAPLVLPSLELASAGDGEAARRCRAVVTGHHARRTQAAFDEFCRVAHWPWIVTDGANDHHLWEARQVTGCWGGPDWPEYREATRLLATGMASRGEPLGPVLAHFWREEIRWRAYWQGLPLR